MRKKSPPPRVEECNSAVYPAVGIGPPDSVLRHLPIESASLGHEHELQAVWTLTEKEFEVFQWLVRGKVPIEVATILGKSRQTVRHQAAAVYKKLRVFGHPELVSKFVSYKSTLARQ
jgi:DNA-binding CsgD family transcriptional regulator